MAFSKERLSVSLTLVDIYTNNMKKPQITVVMPCYNASRYVEEAIKSVLCQSFEDFEFIIINDGSVDDTDKLIQSFEDKRIVYINHKTNKGNYHARNEGIRMAKGRFICVMDADDISYESRLNSQYNFMISHPKIGCCGSDADMIDEFGNLVGKIVKPSVNRGKLSVLFLVDNFILHPSLILRRSSLLKYKLLYNTKYRYAADFDFVGRCLRHFSVVNTGEVLLKYRVHNTQISNREKTLQKDFADQIRLARLSEFRLNLEKEEKDIYLKLISNVGGLDYYEKEKSLIVLNKLLLSNEKVKLYKTAFLYNFFEYLLARTILCENEV
jgi:glycosyltransferase involved in cell wall biosynthesis